jgi:hypothetical protein
VGAILSNGRRHAGEHPGVDRFSSVALLNKVSSRWRSRAASEIVLTTTALVNSNAAKKITARRIGNAPFIKPFPLQTGQIVARQTAHPVVSLIHIQTDSIRESFTPNCPPLRCLTREWSFSLEHEEILKDPPFLSVKAADEPGSVHHREPDTDSRQPFEPAERLAG